MTHQRHLPALALHNQTTVVAALSRKGTTHAPSWKGRNKAKRGRLGWIWTEAGHESKAKQFRKVMN